MSERRTGGRRDRLLRRHELTSIVAWENQEIGPRSIVVPTAGRFFGWCLVRGNALGKSQQPSAYDCHTNRDAFPSFIVRNSPGPFE